MTSAGFRHLEGWHSAPDYVMADLQVTMSKFNQISDLLMERPNLNSSHLFRADIISDSAGSLQTVSAKEKAHYRRNRTNHDSPPEPCVPIPDIKRTSQTNSSHNSVALDNTNVVEGFEPLCNVEPFDVPGFHLVRTVMRRLIPRKPNVDRLLDQSCFFYDYDRADDSHDARLVIYVPHAVSEDDLPWYHPQVKAIAYRYESGREGGTLSIHYKLFTESNEVIPTRLHRTLLALLHTFSRLVRLDAPAGNPTAVSGLPVSLRPMNAAALRDSILPQHIVQDTYTRLKQTYAADLIARWVEKTDPSKHVFEDLAIAAFLIELWKCMYDEEQFPGFVDIACGNGVLVYILVKEGYMGHGFDARKRQTWEALGIDDRVEEMLCLPKLFGDALADQTVRDAIGSLKVHDGLFKPGTFVISNHADELTPWTPILAALSCREEFLPFLAIPCCSHALSGAKHRYSLKDVDVGSSAEAKQDDFVEDANPSSGDLRALRAQKMKAASHGDNKSTYACLTKKTVALAEELGYETEVTLMRIPSTRNIGIVGNRNLRPSNTAGALIDRVEQMVTRECSISGGVEAAATTWIERAHKLVEGKGRGKVNLGGRPC